MRQPQFSIYTLAGGIATSATFGYIAASANVFLNLYKASEREYGWIFAFVASGLIGSAQFNHFLLKKFTSQQLVKYALAYQTFAGTFMVMGTLFDWYNMTGLTIMIFLFVLGQGLTGPNSAALALAPFSKHAGSAASLLGSFRMLVGGIITVLVSAWYDGTALPMVFVMWMSVVIAIIILGLAKVTISYRARRRVVEDEPVVLL